MRKLEDQQGVQLPSPDYPKGRTVNDLTLISEEIDGDIIQFFQKLVIEAGLTENGNPDNVTNKYQLISALDDYLLEDENFTIVPDGDYGSSKFQRNYLAGDKRNLSYRITKDGYLELRGDSIATVFTEDDTIFTLPGADYYPPFKLYQFFYHTADKILPFYVDTSGDVKVAETVVSGSSIISFACKLPLFPSV